MNQELDEIIKISIDSAKKNVIDKMSVMIVEEYEKRILQKLGVEKSDGWQKRYKIIPDGVLDVSLNDFVEKTSLEELNDFHDTIFKYVTPLTPTEVKHIKNEIRSALRYNAIETVKRETVNKLQKTVNEYATSVLEQDNELEQLINLDKLINL